MGLRKAAIAGVLGERGLLLPERIHEALAANGRAKYFLTLLQLARAHADSVAESVPDLREDREQAGIADDHFDSVVAESRAQRDGTYRIPLVNEILQRLLADTRAMIAPVKDAPVTLQCAASAWFDERLAALAHNTRPRDGQTLSRDALRALISSDREQGDSLHLLVFDLHKAIDHLAAALATEDIDGAKGFCLEPGDRPLIAAFMTGVHQTEILKFGHPGLGTTATRAGKVLILENDIGETSAHILVVHIEGLRATVTSTDVHLRRLEFLQRLLAGYALQWTDLRSRSASQLQDVGLFYECSGTLLAQDVAELERFLTRLGSRLVFLIDWNRARKVLRTFVPKEASLELLGWAAAEDWGHRGFLELGGEQLIFDAMAAVIRTPLRFGERLDDVLSAEPAGDFLRGVLRTCSAGLRAGRSRSVLRAEVRAELMKRVRAGGERLLGPVAEHAAIVVELARGLCAQLGALEGGRAKVDPLAAQNAKASEHRADERVLVFRGIALRIPEAERYRPILELADNAADALEEAVHLLTLLPEAPASALRSVPLVALGELLVSTAENYEACVRAARSAVGGDVQGVLDTFDALARLEHQMDEAEREVTGTLARDKGIDAKLFVITSRAIGQMEHAVDELTRAALGLRDRVMSR